jgi:putative transposase
MNREIIRRRDLPHWDVPDAAYFITTCLEGSIPAQGLLDISHFRTDVATQTRPANVTEAEWKITCWKKSFVRVENWLDGNPARRDLQQPELASTVANAMRYFAQERYDLYAYVVMPSHIHWLFQPKKEWIALIDESKQTPRQRIVHSLNRFTASQCNEILSRTGIFWQHESFDHWVRDIDELERIMRYIEENPVKALLAKSPEDWPYSSAFIRKQLGLEWGEPIPMWRQD